MARCVWLLILTGLLAAGGCGQKPADPPSRKLTTDDVRRDASQAVDTAAAFTRQSKEEFQKQADARLKELDADIAKLRAKGRGLQDKAKADWDRKLADLEAKRDAVRVKLVEVGRASAEAWKDLRKGAQSAWGELDKAFRDASREF